MDAETTSAPAAVKAEDAASATDGAAVSEFGLYGLGVMGQNYALNIASKGFSISVCNRSSSKVDTCVARAKKEGLEDKVFGFKDPKEFVASLKKPRRLMFLVKAGPVVDAVIKTFADLLEEGDIMIDGGNEWYENSIRRAEGLKEKKIMYVAMGVSGGEEGARNGPSIMPAGPLEAWKSLKPILEATSAKTYSVPCVAWLGEIGSGNYVKMVHNGIEYGDMQLIAEAYEILKHAGLGNLELAKLFEEWNKGELQSFLIEISAKIFAKKDEDVIDWKDSSTLPKGEGFLLDKILDATGNKGTGKMTVKEAATQGVACPTISSALDARFMAFGKADRVAAEPILKKGAPSEWPDVNRADLIQDVQQALYASKICSYAQGMNLIKAASKENGWGVSLGECARIWKGGCIIRAQFLDRITKAYKRNPDLSSLLVDPEFAADLIKRQMAWRRVVTLGIATGIAVPAMAASLGYFDQYRKARLPANLVQAQRDYFGSHTFERTDKPRGEKFHCIWTDAHKADTGH